MEDCAKKSALHKKYTLGLVPIPAEFTSRLGFEREAVIDGILGLTHYRERGEELNHSATTTTTSKQAVTVKLGNYYYTKFARQATLGSSLLEF